MIYWVQKSRWEGTWWREEWRQGMKEGKKRKRQKEGKKRKERNKRKEIKERNRRKDRREEGRKDYRCSGRFRLEVGECKPSVRPVETDIMLCSLLVQLYVGSWVTFFPYRLHCPTMNMNTVLHQIYIYTANHVPRIPECCWLHVSSMQPCTRVSDTHGSVWCCAKPHTQTVHNKTIFN